MSNQLPVTLPSSAESALPLDGDLAVRWAAWVARGRVHEEKARRKFVAWAGVLALVAAIGYALLGS
jgi:hypothetical protein